MAKITISGVAEAFTKDPSGEPTTDPAILQSLHGLVSDDHTLDFLDLPDELADVVTAGGRIRFYFDETTKRLRVSSAYDVTRDLTDKERKHLIKETVVQWSDGAGSGSFATHQLQVLSSGLAQAIRNAEGQDTDVGELFVDAYPFLADDHDIKVVFDADGSCDDEVIADLKTAADVGDLGAILMLAGKYESGEGVEVDEPQAFALYERAAKEGHPFAITMAGRMMQAGRGCPEDPVQAVEYLKRAVEMDFPLAMHMLGECYAEGLGVPTDPSKAVELYRQGAEFDDPGCLAELGDCLEFGNGVGMDLEAALECYQSAAELGLDAVAPAIKRVKKKMR